MRIPSYVPALLLIAGFGLVAVDVFEAAGSVRPTDDIRYHHVHSDDNLTFIAARLWNIQAGDEVRLVAPGSESLVVVRTMDGETRPGDPDPFVHVALNPPALVLVPAGTAQAFATGEVTVLARFAPSSHPVFEAPRVPSALVAHPIRDDGIDVVWVYENTTQNYPLLAQGLVRLSENRLPAAAMDDDFLRIEPVYRGLAWAFLVAAVAAALWPRRIDAAMPTEGLAGAAIDLVELGATFLRRLRNAYIALVAVVVALGVPVVMALALFAGDLWNGHSEPVSHPYAGWQVDVFVLLVASLVAAILVAGRPAWAAHQTLTRWNRLAEASPIEGEL